MRLIQNRRPLSSLLALSLLAAPVIAQPRFTDVTEEAIPLPLFEGPGLALGATTTTAGPICSSPKA